MKSRIILILLLCLSCELCAQVEGIIVNKETNTPVPYANIWIANEETGTTSDIGGHFIFKEKLINKSLVISAIGYERTIYQIDSSNLRIALIPKTYQIQEVEITPGLYKDFVVGGFDKSQVSYGLCPMNPSIFARLFQWKEEYGKGAIIRSIRIRTSSKAAAKINLRIFGMSENGEPGKDFLSDNLIVPVKKGRKTIAVNIPHEQIFVFPETDVFVAVEFLIIKENEYRPLFYTNTETSKVVRNRGEIIAYMPFIGIIESDQPNDSYIYSQGKWRKEEQLSHMKKDKLKNQTWAIELTLSR